jgi:UDP-3-O-[3-hydroxymyristoyl] glucosamine N-acyltransferase
MTAAATAHVDPTAEIAEEVTIAPGAVIYGQTRIGAGSSIGALSVVHPGTRLGAGCVVEEHVVLGKRPRLRPNSSAAGALGPLVLGDEVTVCCGAVVYAGSSLGARVIVGDQSQVRERVEVGESSVVGRGSTVDFDTRIGDRVLIQTGVYVTGGSLVEDDVFLGPGVCTTNDDTMGRHPRAVGLAGPTFRRACRVGGGVVLVPGIVVGEEAFIAAGAVITRDVAAREVVLGVPGRAVRRVPDGDLIERWR